MSDKGGGRERSASVSRLQGKARKSQTLGKALKNRAFTSTGLGDILDGKAPPTKAELISGATQGSSRARSQSFGASKAREASEKAGERATTSAASPTTPRANASISSIGDVMFSRLKQSKDIFAVVGDTPSTAAPSPSPTAGSPSPTTSVAFGRSSRPEVTPPTTPRGKASIFKPDNNNSNNNNNNNEGGEGKGSSGGAGSTPRGTIQSRASRVAVQAPPAEEPTMTTQPSSGGAGGGASTPRRMMSRGASRKSWGPDFEDPFANIPNAATDPNWVEPSPQQASTAAAKRSLAAARSNSKVAVISSPRMSTQQASPAGRASAAENSGPATLRASQSAPRSPRASTPNAPANVPAAGLGSRNSNNSNNNSNGNSSSAGGLGPELGLGLGLSIGEDSATLSPGPSPMTMPMSPNSPNSPISPGPASPSRPGRRAGRRSQSYNPNAHRNSIDSDSYWSDRWNRWRKMVDDKALGAHWEPRAPELPSALAMDDADQKELDSIHADMLHKRRPDESPHPKAGQAMPSQFTAFADRAVRLREGRYMRSNMMHGEPAPAETNEHVNCSCPTCMPQIQPPAGVPSHEVGTNKVPRSWKDTPLQLAPHEDQTRPNHNMNSSLVSKAILHEDAERNPEIVDLQFSQFLGRKIRGPTSPRAESVTPHDDHGSGMLPHRAAPEDKSPAAGQYDQDLYAVMPDRRNRTRQPWQAGRTDEPQRSGVAYVLSPRQGDPPPPTKIASICRAGGMFKTGYSEDAARISAHRNQEMFRFEDPKSPRSRSLPPGKIDPKEFAGQPTGAPVHHMHDQSNPLTMEGKSTVKFALGSHVAIGEHKTFRKAIGNDSSYMAFAMNHEMLNKSFDHEKTWRLQNDENFARLCSHTAAVVNSAREHAEMNKTANGHSASQHVKTHLFWME